jgi:hypothetical protein
MAVGDVGPAEHPTASNVAMNSPTIEREKHIMERTCSN